MCLLVDNWNFKVATKDITCYKILIKYKDTYLTPFNEMDVTEYVHSHEPICDTKIINYGTWKNMPCIEEGMFHSFTNLKEAKKYIKLFKTYGVIGKTMHWGKNDFTDFVICKCAIPTTSQYIKGIFPVYELPWNEYTPYKACGSTHIKFLKIIK